MRAIRCNQRRMTQVTQSPAKPSSSPLVTLPPSPKFPSRSPCHFFPTLARSWPVLTRPLPPQRPSPSPSRNPAICPTPYRRFQRPHQASLCSPRQFTQARQNWPTMPSWAKHPRPCSVSRLIRRDNWLRNITLLRRIGDCRSDVPELRLTGGVFVTKLDTFLFAAGRRRSGSWRTESLPVVLTDHHDRG